MRIRRAPATLALLALAGALRPAPNVPAVADASRRVAEAVERDEPLFDATLWLMSVRRAAGWLCIGCGAAAVVLGALARRAPRGQS